MRARSRRLVLVRRGAIVLASVLAVWALAVVRPSGQQREGYRAPRLAGTQHPDLNGIWQAMNAANYDVRPHAARPALATVSSAGREIPAAPVLALGAIGGVPGSSGVVEGGEIPYQPWAAKQQEENFRNSLARDPEVKCYLPGVPRATYMPYPFQIVQTAGSDILIAYEYAAAVRTINMSAPAPADANISSWMGASNGRWEGETLVVEVTGLSDESWFDRSGNFHSEELRVVERYTRTSPDHIQYEATMADPKVFTRPWTIRMPLYRHIEPNAELMEYRCVEFVEELMFGDLRKEQVLKRWEEDLGERGGRLAIDVTRGPSRSQ